MPLNHAGLVTVVGSWSDSAGSIALAVDARRQGDPLVGGARSPRAMSLSGPGTSSG
jgi:hypothetical protein